MFSIFKKQEQKPPSEKAKEWKSKIRQEMRSIDRAVDKIVREEGKLKQDIRAAAKRNDTASVRVMAKEVVRSTKTRERMLETKAKLNSVSNSLTTQMATIKMTEAVKSSSEVMNNMSAAVKAAEVSSAMRDVQKEMIKMGLIEERIEDTMSALDSEDIEDDVDDEVVRVLNEMAIDVSETLGVVPQAQLPTKEGVAITGRTEGDPIQTRLNAL